MINLLIDIKMIGVSDGMIEPSSDLDSVSLTLSGSNRVVSSKTWWIPQGLSLYLPCVTPHDDQSMSHTRDLS
jgi:hypothetical protein